MLVENQYIDVKITGKTLNYYKNLNYPAKVSSIIAVQAEHLPINSAYRVNVICDYCGEICEKTYQQYFLQRKILDKDACYNCKGKKTQESMDIQYGIKNVACLQSAKDRTKETNLQKYGVQYSSQLEICKDKTKKTNLKKYGVENPSQSSMIRNKVKETNFARYGVEHPFQSEEIMRKAKNTLLERYGVEHALQNEEIRAKAIQSYTANDTIRTSKQQREIYNMLCKVFNNVQLNYPFGRCALDVALFQDDINIDIEYDCWYWHQFKQKEDRKRDEYLKLNDWKILRIKSGHKLPTENELIESVNKLLNSNRKYTEIILDDWKEGND